MKHTQIQILCLLLATLLTACVKKPSGSVSLHLEHAPKRALALFELTPENGAVFIDSLRPDRKGNYRFSFPDDSLRLYILANAKDRLCVLSAPGKKLHLQADYYSLSASAFWDLGKDSLCPNVVFLRYQQNLQKAEEAIQHITDLWMEHRYRTTHPDSLHAVCSARIDSIAETIKQEAVRISFAHTGTLIPVFVFNKTLGQRSVFDASTPQDLLFMLECATEMEQKNPQNPHVRRLRYNLSRIESFRKQEALRQMEKSGKTVTN